ncbi:MAG: hypothetical protein L6Q75_17140 [Burkholderiaceae bacterium]|jgi:hypothetical protein|nr:hypothetical protein [Burkholderiaceae bacterium]
MTDALHPTVAHLLQSATPVLTIHGLAGRRWVRNVPASDARHGPWLQAGYEVLDEATWQRPGACLYLVTGRDAGLRYVGISRNGLKHRWRLSPALDAQTRAALPDRQLFHSQCWKHIESECAADSQARFTVHCLGERTLIEVLRTVDDPIRHLAELDEDGETVTAGVERWICNRASASLARWNVAMTARRAASR